MSDDYARIASALRTMADRLDTLAGLDLPERPYVGVSIEPGGLRLGPGPDDDVTIAAVDAVSRALLDTPGVSYRVSGDTWHHRTGGRVGPVRVDVFDLVGDPERRRMRDELAQLRAQLAERDAEVTP